ncbi:MAG: hypothetical protein IIW83_01725, partial [Clostridia bacterium]|nr:hypothetical protein [Clostridia bacterium]
DVMTEYKCVNGVKMPLTEEEIAEAKNELLKIPYEQRVVDRIRLKYSVDDELAILRQRDTKPDEFIAYNDFVERIKAEEKEAVSGK